MFHGSAPHAVDEDEQETAIYQEEVAALKLQGEEKKRSDVTTYPRQQLRRCHGYIVTLSISLFMYVLPSVKYISLIQQHVVALLRNIARKDVA